MDLYLQSLRLSVHTFWRYLIVVTLAGFTALALIRRAVASDVIWLFAIAPVVLISLLFVFYTALLACVIGVVVLGGIYCALVARGHEVTKSFGHLALLMLLVGLCAFTCYFVVGCFGYIILFVAGQAGGPGDARALLLGFQQGSPMSHILMLLILTPAAFCLSAAASPLFSILHNDQDRGWTTQATVGFGNAMRQLMPMSTALLYYGLLLIAFGRPGLFLSFDGAGLAIYGALVWAASWFFSHAVLIWEETVALRDRDLALVAERMAENRVDPRSLRLAREQKNPEII